MDWTLRPALASDVGWIAELRADVLREDLARLGRYDPVRVRERFRSGFSPALTRVIVVDGEDAGSIAVRTADDGIWIEHFYLAPHLQGRGIGTGVLAHVLSAGGVHRLNVLQGSPARRLYERHGFALDSEDEVDVFLVRR
ncbi:GNAT family N-acetyltransferase [Microbacterium gilvum]|uniref:GNAT family N-acetyltransferase n=1 Tax=Microbacterium gilvum TaxID=1336204 RepID=A0ABP9AR35_9MICO